MSLPIRMPAIAANATHTSLARWLKQEGEPVSIGETLAELETDKAVVELVAEHDGVLGRILVGDASNDVPVGQEIAILLAPGEDASVLDTVVAAAPAAEATASPAAGPMAVGTTPLAEARPRVFASPLARRLARERGLALEGLRGSGPHGRIVRRDVEHALAAPISTVPVAAPAPAAPVAAPVAPSGKWTAIPNNGMRRTIARRLSESKQTVPHFYLSVDCEIDRLLALRTELNGRAKDFRLSVNDFIVRAVALALRDVPAANASWTDEAILRYDTVDVCVAVATPGGLVTPVVRDADRKGLAALSTEVRELAERGRDNRLRPEEMSGGSFTISNLGMYGIKSFSAIINPPQSCILAVGQAEQRPVVREGELAVATVMSCTLSVDHRSVDGAVGAEFLAAFRRYVEQPLDMLL